MALRSEYCRLSHYSAVDPPSTTTTLSEPFSEAAPKDKKIGHGNRESKEAHKQKDKLFVGVQHVQTCPKLEAVHPLGEKSIIGAEYIRVGVGESSFGSWKCRSCHCDGKKISSVRFVGEIEVLGFKVRIHSIRAIAFCWSNFCKCSTEEDLSQSVACGVCRLNLRLCVPTCGRSLQ